MNKQNNTIHIIGAGISGLIAARVLEDHGFEPIVIEATERAGGRVKTDILNGYQLDHGFQVLLTAYPSAQKYLNLKALDLQHFLPGASIFKNKKQHIIGDPLRDFSLLTSTVFSGIGTIADKLNILKLNFRLKKKTLDQIFSDKEQTTLSYLQDLGFSSEMIETFFKPFFSGIFLENTLETSSRMFEFVYKMFGEGYAALPKSGIEAIPKQLVKNMKQTTFMFNSKVETVTPGEIRLTNGQILKSDFTIIATEARGLLRDFKASPTKWKTCDTLYFETENRVIQKPLIGLIPGNETVINNIFYHTSLPTAIKAQKELLSVTVIDAQNIEKEELIDRVKSELKHFCGITTENCIQYYRIPFALPDLVNLKLSQPPKETQVAKGIFLAGDAVLNGSLNAAMQSGETAAFALLEEINGESLQESFLRN